MSRSVSLSLLMALSFELGTPINTALFLYILYAVQRIIFPPKTKRTTIPNEFKAGYSWMPKSHPPTVMYKTYTPKTLQHFSGLDGGRILLAINGIVFDVTAGRNFYGPSACCDILSFCVRTLINCCFSNRWDVWKLCGTRCFSRNG